MTKRLQAALLAVLTMALTLSACAGEPPLTITAHFRDTVGLYVGNNVAILGLDVGKITAIEPKGTSMQVELTLDPGTKVPADAGAVTLSPSVVTDRRVELTPAYTGGPTMADGDVIPLERTRTPVEIDTVFTAVEDLAHALSKQNAIGPIEDVLDVSSDAFAGNGKEIRETIAKLADAVNVGVENRDDIVQLIKNARVLMAGAAANDKKIRSFSRNLTEITELFAGQSPKLVKSLRTLTGLLDQTEGLLTDNRASLRRSVTNLRRTTKTLAGRTREMAETTDLLPLLFENATRATDPETGVARAHGLLDEIVLHSPVDKVLCETVPQLPACTGESFADLGPDGGITELLLGVVTR